MWVYVSKQHAGEHETVSKYEFDFKDRKITQNSTQFLTWIWHAEEKTELIKIVWL